MNRAGVLEVTPESEKNGPAWHNLETQVFKNIEHMFRIIFTIQHVILAGQSYTMYNVFKSV